MHVAPFGSWVHTNSSGTAGTGAVFTTETTIENHGSTITNVSVKATLFDANNAVVESSLSKGILVSANSVSKPIVLPIEVQTGIKKWTIQSPYLYVVKIELLKEGSAVDSVDIKTGHRVVRWDPDQGLFINDESISEGLSCPSLILSRKQTFRPTINNLAKTLSQMSFDEFVLSCV